MRSFRSAAVLASLAPVFIGSTSIRMADAGEMSVLGTVLTREEDLLLPLTTVPAPHSTFGGRLGIEWEFTRNWTLGPSSQWTESRFRAESPEGKSDLRVESFGVQFFVGRRIQITSELSAKVGPILEYAETTSDFDSRNSTSIGSESSLWAGGLRVRAELRAGERIGFFAEASPMVGSAKASLPTQAIASTWTSSSLDIGVGIRWILVQ